MGHRRIPGPHECQSQTIRVPASQFARKLLSEYFCNRESLPDWHTGRKYRWSNQTTPCSLETLVTEIHQPFRPADQQEDEVTWQVVTLVTEKHLSWYESAPTAGSLDLQDSPYPSAKKPWGGERMQWKNTVTSAIRPHRLKGVWPEYRMLCRHSWRSSKVTRRRDSYLTHLRSGITHDTLNALRTAPLHRATLLPNSALKMAEEEIAQFENKGHSTSSSHKKGHYHP